MVSVSLKVKRRRDGRLKYESIQVARGFGASTMGGKVESGAGEFGDEEEDRVPIAIQRGV
jgi:hypothetical protein